MATAVLLVAAGVIGDTFIEDDNFRLVDADLFRSGQLRSDEWSEDFAETPFRSVVNLRGAEPSQPWYRLEIAFAQAHGIEHYDVRLSANDEPSLAEMRQLVELVRSAPKPLLVHCKNGSDRSGLVAALYKLAVKKEPLARARDQLSLWFGHFPWLTSRTGAMDQALSAYADAEQQHAARGGQRQASWPAVEPAT